MTRLIYPSPVELDGHLMVSTEVQTHYRCPHCNVFSSASDLLPDERTVYCHSCGSKVELPKPILPEDIYIPTPPGKRRTVYYENSSDR